MKRIPNDQITSLATHYFKRRNFSQSYEKMKQKNIAIKDMALNGGTSAEESSPNVISLSSCVSDFNLKAEESFVKFVNFTSNCDESFKSQLSCLEFPIYAHIYIELFLCGHKMTAKRFFKEHKNRFHELTDHKLIIDSIANSLESPILDSALAAFRNSKYAVILSDECLRYINEHIEILGDLIIMQILNSCIDIRLNSFGSDPEIEYPNELTITSQYVQNQLPEKSSVSSMKSFIASDINSFPSIDKQTLTKSIQRVHECVRPLPAISLYSIKSECLSCVSVSNDINFIAFGFENSSICLLNLNPLDSSENKDNEIFVKRKPSQIDIAFDPIDDNDGDESNDNHMHNDSAVMKNVHSKVPHVIHGHGGPIYGLTFVPRSDILLSCSEDTTVRAWSSSQYHCIAIYNGHSYPIWSIDSAQIGNYFVTSSKDTTARLWSLDRTFPLRVYAGHTMDINCVKFHPNCNYIATGSADKTIRLWDVQSGRLMRSYFGHHAAVDCLAFSPNGKLLASAGEDGCVKIWDLSSGKVMHDYDGHTDVTDVSFNRNDSIVASCGIDRSLKLWNVKCPVDSVNPNAKTVDSSKREYKSSTELPDLMASYRLKVNSLLYTKFMPNNLLLSVGTKL